MSHYTRQLLLTSLFALSYLSSTAIPARGQESKEKATGESTEATGDLFALPSIPAFTFLNVSPEKISRPGTLKDVAVDLVSGVDKDGRSVQGVALEISVAELGGPAISLKEYQGSRTKFILQNLRISLGTVKASGDSASTDAALGIRIPIFNNSDPMTDAMYTKELGQVLITARPATPQDTTNIEALRGKKRDLDKRWQSEHWNASRLEFALAFSGRCLNSELGNGKFLGSGFWGTLGVALGRWGQVLALLQYEYRNNLPGQLESNDLTYGGRLVAGTPRINLFGELLGTNSFLKEGSRPTGASEHASGSWSLGVEYRLANGLWLATGLGAKFETLLDESDRVALIAGLRWGISSEARLNPRS